MSINVYYSLFIICTFVFFTLLKLKSESNSTWDNFNSFPLIQSTFSSWVEFSQLIYLKKYTQTSVFSVNLHLKKIKSELNTWKASKVLWTYKWICALFINAHNAQGCPEIESSLLSSAVKLKQSVVIILTQKYRSI